jgi:hypothetical protein
VQAAHEQLFVDGLLLDGTAGAFERGQSVQNRAVHGNAFAA